MNTTNRNSGADLTPRHEPAPHKKNRPWAGWLRACAPGLFFLLAAALPPAAQAGILVIGGTLDSGGAVVCGGDGDYGSITGALAGASDGDEIVACPGEWSGSTANLSSKSGSLTIRGATGNPGDVTLKASGNVFQAGSGNLALTLKDMTLSTNGSSTVVNLTPSSEVPYVFENLIVKNSLSGSGEGFTIGKSSSVTIRNTTIKTGGHGISLTNANKGTCLLENTQVHSHIFRALYSAGSASITMNGGTLISEAQEGVYIAGGTAATAHHFTGVTIDAGGIGVDFAATAAGNHSFTDMIVKSGSTAFRFLSPGDVTMKGVEATPTTGSGVLINNTTGGTYEFTGIKMKSVGVTLDIAAPGNVTMNDVSATSTADVGIRIVDSTGGANEFTDVDVISRGAAFHIYRPGNITMTRVTGESAADIGVRTVHTGAGAYVFKTVTMKAPGAAFHIQRPGNVTMNGATAISTGGIGVYLSISAAGGPSNIKLDGVKITAALYGIQLLPAGTAATRGIDVSISNTLIETTNTSAMGIYVPNGYTTNGPYSIRNTTVHSLNTGSFGIYLNGTSKSVEIDNTCVIGGAVGISIQYTGAPITITRSTVHSNNNYSVAIYSAQSVKLTNNDFIRNVSSTYSLSNVSSAGQITVSGNYWNGARPYSAGGIYESNASTTPNNNGCYSGVPQVNHFRIEYAGEGVTCAPEDVTVTACANENCSKLYTDNLVLTLSGQGAASVTPKGSINNGVGYFSVRRTVVGDVIFSIASSTPDAANGWFCFKDGVADSGCAMNFVESALKFYHSDGTNVLPGLPNLISAKPSGPVYLRALKTDQDNPQRCAPGITGKHTVDFRACFQDPATGTMPVNLSADAASYAAVNTVGSSSCAGSNVWTPVELDFGADAEATLHLRYDDAGKMNLRARYQEEVDDGDENTPIELLTLNASDSFIARPAGFCVQRPDPLTNPDNRTGYCTATNKAACAPFIAAGDEFDLLVRAVAWESDADADFCTGNAVTPNYKAFNFDRLKQVLEAPLPGKTGDLEQISQTEGSGTVVKTLTLSEVGVFHFEVEHDYMGAGAVKGVSAPIGRFIPASFKLVPIQQAGCSIATTPFTYAGLAGAQPTDSPQKDGQPFEVSATIQALNRDGDITQNYYGDFMRLVPGSSTVPSSFTAAAIGSDDNVYSDGSLSAWNVTSLNMAEGTNPVTDLNAGTGDMAGQAKFIFNSLNAPADIAIRLTATDTDDVTGEAVTGLAQQRIGRLVVGSAHSHLEDVGLTIAAETQFYNGTGYELSSGDVCTSIPVSLVGLAGSLVGKTGLDSTYAPTVTNGYLWLPFTAPKASGFVDATIYLVNSTVIPDSQWLPWLLYDWDGNGIHDNNPMGRASWGLFRGSPDVIRLREVWN